MSKVKSSIKIKYVRRYLKGNISQREIAGILGVSLAAVQQWICNYKILGSVLYVT